MATKNNSSVKEEKTITFIKRDKPQMPDGKVLSKSTNIRVEQIENGYLVVEDHEMKYQTKDGEPGWHSWCTKTYSETNPVQANGTGSIADFF